MRKLFICFTALCFVTAQMTALANPHDEGLAAGVAANPIIRGNVNAPSASSVVPDYTTAPAEARYYGQSLSGQANAQLATCAADDPSCQAQRAAFTSANTPRPALSLHDPALVGAREVARDPSTVLGSLSSFYPGCTLSTCPANVFCLGSSCFNTNYTNDADFARTMSMMEAAREAGVYLDPDSLQVFKGEASSCRDRLFTNCCYIDSRGAGMSNQSVLGVGSRLVFDILMNSENRHFIYQGIQALLTSSGFSGSFTSYGVTFAVNGASVPVGSVTLAATDSLLIAFDPWSLAIAVTLYVVMSMASCNENEARVALKEGAALCRSLGTYCSSCIRVLGRCVACIERTTGKCCFNSRLARIVNEQGRAQVGKGWGSAQSPDCSGFGIAQLQSLDFAAMDLSEFYASIVPTLPNLDAIRTKNAGQIPNCYYGQGRCQ